MKSTIRVIIIMVVASLLTSCSLSTVKNNTANSALDYKLGVIETTGYRNQSFIHFFDENLVFQKKEMNNYSSMSEPFDCPIYENGFLFSIPKGEFGIRDNAFILKYDISKDTYEEISTGLYSMNSLAVSNEYVFGVNTINGKSTIVRCKKNDSNDSKDILSKEYSKTYISKIVVLQDELYAIFNSIEQKIFLVKLSIDTLDVVEKFDITKYGSPCDIIDINDKLYISNQYSNEITAELSSCITVFDKSTKSFTQIDTSEYSPNNMLVMKGLLFTSHYDRVQDSGNKISVTDLYANKSKVYTLNHPVKQIITDNYYLYVLGDRTVYKYTYENDKLSEVNHVELSKNKSSNLFYVTSFFLIN